MKFHLKRAMKNMLFFDKNALEFVVEFLASLHKDGLWNDFGDLLDILPHDLQCEFLSKVEGPLEELMAHGRRSWADSDTSREIEQLLHSIQVPLSITWNQSRLHQ